MSELILHARGGDYKIEPPDERCPYELEENVLYNSQTILVSYQLVEPENWTEDLHSKICAVLTDKFGIDKGAVNWKSKWHTDFVEATAEHCNQVTLDFVRDTVLAIIDEEYSEKWYTRNYDFCAERYIEEMD